MKTLAIGTAVLLLIGLIVVSRGGRRLMAEANETINDIVDMWRRS